MKTGALALALGGSVVLARPASAARRIGLFVGSNAAAFGAEEPLRHAESDAARMRQVLVELGGIEDADAVLLHVTIED